MKKHYIIIVSLFLIMAFAHQGCKSKTNRATQEAEKNAEKALTIDETLKSAEILKGKEVEVEGICTHICKHGGGKIFLMGSDDTQTIRIEAGKAFGKFKPETVNHIVCVEGVLVEDRIDEAYLTQWEEQLKAQTEAKHGDSEAGCSTEQKARGEAPANSTASRISNFRKRIAERNEKEGKNYLSFYHIDATGYTIR